jgi:hypothetical protein
MNRSTKDSRAWRLWSHLVLVAVIASTTVGAIAPFLSVTVLAASMLVDIVSSVMRSSIVDEALLNWHLFPTSRRWLLMD